MAKDRQSAFRKPSQESIWKISEEHSNVKSSERASSMVKSVRRDSNSPVKKDYKDSILSLSERRVSRSGSKAKVSDLDLEIMGSGVGIDSKLVPSRKMTKVDN